MLNKVNEEISQTETQKSNDEAELADEQKYLAIVKRECDDTAKIFEIRKHDRAQEKIAVGEAVKVLSGDAGDDGKESAAALLQVRASQHTGARPCRQCQKASALLSKAARSMRSQTLADAAAAAGANEAVQDVINALDRIVSQIDADQKMEREHKEWCEGEMSATSDKKEHHEGRVDGLVAMEADTTEAIADETAGLESTNAKISRTDGHFQELTRIRAREKEDFDKELDAFRDAIMAMNEAIDILAKFYEKKRKDALQNSQLQLLERGEQRGDVAPREMAPGIFDHVYEEKGGAGIVGMLTEVRAEFELGMKDLRDGEAILLADYQSAKHDHVKARRDLEEQVNRLTVQKQTDESNLAEYQEDEADHRKEVKSAQGYMKQLKGSCESLLEHFESRADLRKDEKKAIKNAIKILEDT